MTKEKFIEKWFNRNGLAHPAQKEVFESDLNSLFNLRTETRTREEVRERLILCFNKPTFKTQKGLIYQRLNKKEISLLKWFLKE